MAMYFFDLRIDQAVASDDEGTELPDIEAAHDEALEALGSALQEIVVSAKSDQRFAVQVRDNYGPVFEISAVLESRSLRKQ